MGFMVKSITLIGAGRMGSAMLNGWLGARDDLNISVVAPNPSPALLDLANDGKITLAVAGGDNPSNTTPSDIVVLAVKPQTFLANPNQFTQYTGPNTILTSVMAGVALSKLAGAFSTRKIVRAMPNTPGSIGQGVTLLAASDWVSDAEFSATASLFTGLGHVEGPMSESALQIGTAISGCGPAYVFYFTEMLAKAGADAGLDADIANRLARHTLTGAAGLIAQDATPLPNLREAVASPGGVTRAALDVMMTETRLGALLQDAIEAAIKRDAELSQ